MRNLSICFLLIVALAFSGTLYAQEENPHLFVITTWERLFPEGSSQAEFDSLGAFWYENVVKKNEFIVNQKTMSHLYGSNSFDFVVINEYKGWADIEKADNLEVNFNMRGSVYESVKKKLCYKAEKEFELSLSVTTLSFEDLYGGKICAALDRQHPRDLFDIKLLFDNEGLTDKIRKAFIVYLISHGRPMIELLNPGLKDIKADFENDFAGMTAEPVNLDDLINTRLELIKRIKESLTKDEVKFILSVKNKEPEWGLLELEGIGNLPGVKYKLMNLNKMEPKKHKLAYEKLKKYLMA